MSDVRRGIAWTSVASVTMGILDALAIVLLLRYWLTPAEYGVAVIATALFPLLDLLADAGMASAIVQADESSQEQLSSAFWASLGISCVVAGGLLVVGPLLGRLQDHP